MIFWQHQPFEDKEYLAIDLMSFFLITLPTLVVACRAVCRVGSDLNYTRYVKRDLFNSNVTSKRSPIYMIQNLLWLPTMVVESLKNLGVTHIRRKSLGYIHV